MRMASVIAALFLLAWAAPASAECACASSESAPYGSGSDQGRA